ncbi:hypothetical protein Tco_1078873 [Tanacetum coccineum]|uniref:Uncharacterized protein n=1 Tax=Tanacetum coccineum TaxID=301880 RepID=A0ABQ5HQH8_9ASTR
MSKASDDIQERELPSVVTNGRKCKESCLHLSATFIHFLLVLYTMNQNPWRLVKDEFQEDKSMAAFWMIYNQFQKFIDWQDFVDYDSQMTEKFFAEYIGIKVTQFRETLLQHMGNVKKSVAERARHQRQYERRVNNRQMQTQESKIDSGSALDGVLSQTLDPDLVIMESNGTESGMHDTSSSLGNYITHVVDANIRLVNDQVPFAEFDSNTSPGSTNMSHRGGEIDQDAEHDQVKNPLLKAEFLKTKDMVEKEVYNELSNRFLQLEKHCFSLEISIQQKEESFQTNKPCKNQDSPEFREFFEINELKAQLQAKNSTINNLKKQIKHVHVKSNEAKVKHDIDVLETINIELESSVAKLLAENEKLNKENEHLKQTYKELYDSIKMTRIQIKDHNNSLIAQVNLNTELKNFAKPSILGKPVLQPHRNQSVVRQQTSFKSERCKFSKPRFASQVDVINNLSKPVTPHYVPKVREFVFVKPHYVIASGSSRNSSNESYGSNDMAHKYYLEKCVFNANHDDCITKFLKKVNSRAKVQSLKTRNINKPVEPKSHTQKPGRQIAIGQRFSLNKSSDVREKPNTTRSCLRWIPTGRIFKTAGLRWIPTGKMFTDSTTKVDSEPPNGSNEDITNLYEFQASILNVNKMTSVLISSGLALHRQMTSVHISSGLALQRQMASADNTSGLGLVKTSHSPTPYVLPSKKDYKTLFQPLFDEYLNPPPRVVSLDLVAVAAQELLIRPVHLH